MKKFVSIWIMLLLVTFCCIVSVNATPVLNPANGHYYDIITGQHGITWIQANSAAQSLTYNGVHGHLVTITSQEEQDFINANFGQYFGTYAYFLGGYKPTRTPDPTAGWTWVTGEPWVYTNWDPSAPNDCYGGDDGITPYCSFEDALEKYAANGDWNDFPSYVSEYGRDGYIVEWEPKCDFSSQPKIEKCFGGIGVQCNEISSAIPFVKDETTCLVTGWMSVGSILHDQCCLKTKNTGYSCLVLFQGSNKCKQDWNEAMSNTVCTGLGAPRQWINTWGPYFTGTAGDNTAKALRAPPGTRVDPNYQYLCSFGRCTIDSKGKTITSRDLCGKYCICQ